MKNTPSPRHAINDLPTSQRPLYRMDDAGICALSTAELIALLIPRIDGLDFAFRLLAHCEEVGGLYRASKEHLMLFPSIGEHKAAQILSALELGRRSLHKSPNTAVTIQSPQYVYDLLYPRIGHKMQEHFVVVLLDTRNNVIGIETLYIGSLNSTVIRIAEVFRPAIIKYAPAIIIAHNHPSGDPSPSSQDISVTKSIVEVGNKLDIDVLDHIIVGCNGRFVSLKEKGLM